QGRQGHDPVRRDRHAVPDFAQSSGGGGGGPSFSERQRNADREGMRMTVRSIDGTPVTTRLAMKMEDSLQAFAVRSACFIGELDVPFSEEFDGHDYGATHVIAYIGDEPIGTVRVRWFKSFAMCERLAVMHRFRGRNVGQLLLERCRQLAESRGCNMLYTQVL